MQWSDVNFTPPSRVLRQFAALWTVFFAGMGAWQAWGHGRPMVGVACLVAALTIGPLGLLKPAAIRPIFVAAMVATFPLGWLVSRCLLGAIFYGLFTPLAALFRLRGRDVLGRRQPLPCASYWQPKPPPRGPASYFHQY